jgi:zinc/manganese transport system ATP-binding protein
VTAQELIGLSGVSAGYFGHAVIDAVTLSLSSGDFCGIVGPSGSGKTTLLRVLLGTVRPMSGAITRFPGVKVAYVPQVETVDWNFPVTVSECVSMAQPATRLRPWRSETEKIAARDVLERLGIGDLERRHIRQLSGGQQQRVFIARALASKPDLLVMDEPTSGVDVATRHDVLHLLGELHDAGTAIILSTHDINGVATHLPRLVCMNKRIIADGSPTDVLTSSVLETTYGAHMEVLQHAGLPIVVDRPAAPKKAS